MTLAGAYVAQHFEAQFPDRLRLPFEFDAVRLAADMRHFTSEAWRRHFIRQNYDGDWSIIPLRAAAGEAHPVRMIAPPPGSVDFADTPLMDACPYIRDGVVSTFHCPVRSVRLMRLTAGSVIKEHHDVDLSFEDGIVRLHIPVVTNDAVDFRLNGTRVVMQAGSCWYLRLADPHSVVNRGVEDRVHLVIDAETNDWVAGVFEQAVVAAQAAE
jgi:hypothetical protein